MRFPLRAHVRPMRTRNTWICDDSTLLVKRPHKGGVVESTRNIKNNLIMAEGGGAHCRDAETDPPKKKRLPICYKNLQNELRWHCARNIVLP